MRSSGWVKVAVFWGWLVVTSVPCFGQTASTIFDLDGERAQRIVVTPGDDLPDAQAGAPAMLLSLSGVLADLRSAREIESFRASIPRNPMIGDAGDAERLCVIHVIGREPQPVRRVDIFRDRRGEFIAVERGPIQPRRIVLNRDVFATMYFSWPVYRGGFDLQAISTEQVFELPQPYTAGRFFMDKPTLGERFLAGGKTSLEPADRVLEEEKFHVRLPRGYSPRSPAGLLIWVSPGSEGAPPETLWPGADSLNLICIGAGQSGNLRSSVDRFQLVFDALATAMHRYHIDPRRVYLVGLSGGAKVSSILLGCFPDVFAGAVPIAGLSCYEQIPSGTGFFYRADYSRPKTATFTLLKTRRIAAMTGRKDFNQVPVRQGAALLQRDGLAVKIYDDPDMGHELPRSESFTEALGWVDEPYRKIRERESMEAAKAMEAYRKRYGDRAPDEAGRRALLKVMEAGPWTEAGWEAAGLLRKAESPQLR